MIKLLNSKNKNGITLIALVITIIVLLILAGISISMLSGDNSLLKRAGDARDDTVVGQEKEQVEMAYVSAAVKKLGGNVTKKNLQDELDLAYGDTEKSELNKKTKVTGSTILKVHYNDTNHNYTVDNGAVTKIADGEIEEIPEDIFVALYNDGTLVFSNNEGDIDSTKVSESYGNIKDINYDGNAEWAYNEDIIKVDILNEILPTNTSWWFCGLYKVTSIENIENINTTNVTDISSMFRDCVSLTSIDVGSFDTSNVTNMSDMFYMDDDFYEYPCLNEIIGLSSFNTSNVTDMNHMFKNCKITELDLSSFDTSKVIDMSVMFNQCSNLQNLDLSNFNTKNVTNMGSMFSGCKKLKTIKVGNNWSIDGLTNNIEHNYMFDGCNLLVGGSGTAYDSNHRDYTYAHVDGGISNPGYFTAK